MKTYKQFLESIDKFKPIDLSGHTKGMDKYSHSPNEVGFHDKHLKANILHKPIHDAAKAAGYHYTHKSDAKIGDKDMTYHTYEKSAGPYSDHTLEITTHKGKVWNIYHKTNTDHS